MQNIFLRYFLIIQIAIEKLPFLQITAAANRMVHVLEETECF